MRVGILFFSFRKENKRVSTMSTNENPIRNWSTLFILKIFAIIQVININFTVEYIRLLISWSYT